MMRNQSVAESTVTTRAFQGWEKDSAFYYAAKRILDVVFSFAMLLIAAPIMLVIALLVKLDSPGPIFFAQERVGAKLVKVNGRKVWRRQNFKVYKFRSMFHKADSAIHRNFVQAFIRNDKQAMDTIQGEETEVRKLVRDPRITRIGHFIRKTSLDELPQLWNVLKGDMTMVGPRPAIQYEVDIYEPWHSRRLEALPGLTGMWQVSARSSADFDEMVKLDLWYIDNKSIWMDLKLIVQTPLAVFARKGAM